MSSHIKVGCKGSTLHGHVCMIGIFELMVNLSTENALQMYYYFFKLCTLSEENACPYKLLCFLNLTPLF